MNPDNVRRVQGDTARDAKKMGAQHKATCSPLSCPPAAAARGCSKSEFERELDDSRVRRIRYLTEVAIAELPVWRREVCMVG